MAAITEQSYVVVWGVGEFQADDLMRWDVDRFFEDGPVDRLVAWWSRQTAVVSVVVVRVLWK